MGRNAITDSDYYNNNNNNNNAIDISLNLGAAAADRKAEICKSDILRIEAEISRYIGMYVCYTCIYTTNKQTIEHNNKQTVKRHTQTQQTNN